MPQPSLLARSASKVFFRKGRNSAQNFNAVDNVDFTLSPGEVVVLMGRSGSGKSTLLNMLAGLLEPSSGLIALDGQDLYALDDATLSQVRNARIGVIPQGHTALHNLTVLENVMLPYNLYRSDDAHERALELLEELGIGDLSECYPSELSGGETRRVAIARALICAPDFILADEPTGDLDDENTDAVLRKLRSTADAGAGVLLVTHEQEALAYADRTLRMTSGALEE